MISQATTTVNYSYVQMINYEELTTLIKFSNSETLEPYYKNINNITINTIDDENYEDDNWGIHPDKKTINVTIKITEISKNVPIINIDEFEELEE